MAMAGKPLILCVDDAWNELEDQKMLLEENGFEVLTASNGIDALQAFVSHPVDLVLLDYHMPQMNGDVAAAQMKACKPDVPVAPLSADDRVPQSKLLAVLCRRRVRRTRRNSLGDGGLAVVIPRWARTFLGCLRGGRLNSDRILIVSIPFWFV
jgi:CheY-like chemotaxis protein